MHDEASLEVCMPEPQLDQPPPPPVKKRKGFAVMDKARQLEIASKGGKSAHAQGTAHKYTSEEARAAGKKGGLATALRRRKQVEVN